jgi:hypothetical protein
MKLMQASLLCSILFPLAALAVLPASAFFAAAPSCKSPNGAKNCNNLVHQVNIIAQEDDSGVVRKVDPRGALTKLGPKLGLSLQEIAKIRSATGYVACLGTIYNNRGTGSGVLYGNGRQLMTAAHVLMDKDGRSRGPCYFQNQAEPFSRQRCCLCSLKGQNPWRNRISN